MLKLTQAIMSGRIWRIGSSSLQAFRLARSLDVTDALTTRVMSLPKRKTRNLLQAGESWKLIKQHQSLRPEILGKFFFLLFDYFILWHHLEPSRLDSTRLDNLRAITPRAEIPLQFSHFSSHFDFNYDQTPQRLGPRHWCHSMLQSRATIISGGGRHRIPPGRSRESNICHPEVKTSQQSDGVRSIIKRVEPYAWRFFCSRLIFIINLCAWSDWVCLKKSHTKWHYQMPFKSLFYFSPHLAAMFFQSDRRNVIKNFISINGRLRRGIGIDECTGAFHSLDMMFPSRVCGAARRILKVFFFLSYDKLSQITFKYTKYCRNETYRKTRWLRRQTYTRENHCRAESSARRK